MKPIYSIFSVEAHVEETPEGAREVIRKRMFGITYKVIIIYHNAISRRHRRLRFKSIC